jgi:hypothetical protein
MDSLFSDRNKLLSSYQGAAATGVSQRLSLGIVCEQEVGLDSAIPKIGNVAEGHHGLALVTLPTFLLI